MLRRSTRRDLKMPSQMTRLELRLISEKWEVYEPAQFSTVSARWATRSLGETYSRQALTAVAFPFISLAQTGSKQQSQIAEDRGTLDRLARRNPIRRPAIS